LTPFELWIVARLDHLEKQLKREPSLLVLVVRETLLLVLVSYRKFRKVGET